MMAGAARSTALRRGVRLEVATVVWMTIEAVLAIAAGVAARSALLTAFGADSVIELVSGVTLLWRLRIEERGGGDSLLGRIEKRATRISAALLLLLCTYVALTSVGGLLL